MTDALTGRLALITGASQNLGLAIATEFAAQGARLIMADLTAPEEAAADLRDTFPRCEAVAIGFDLAVPAAIEAAFRDLADRGFSPDVLVNNAAHLGLDDHGVDEDDDALFRAVLEVNLFGTYACSIHAARSMVAAGRGAIVNISSLAGQRAIPSRLGYNTSKGAIDGMTRSMAIDLARSGVRVNAIAPGYVWSDRWTRIDNEEAADRRSRIPWGEPTYTDEIARLAAFLASEASSSLVGEVINIDGGLAAQQSPPTLFGATADAEPYSA